MGDLTNNFSRSEFACKCGCGLDRIDESLVAALQMARTSTVIPFVINSGCRCPIYNADIGGKGRSAHLPKNTVGEIDLENGTCKAADIACSDWHTLYRMLSDFLRNRFRRVELGLVKYRSGKVTMWIHVDVDRSLPQDVFVVEVKEER